MPAIPASRQNPSREQARTRAGYVYRWSPWPNDVASSVGHGPIRDQDYAAAARCGQRLWRMNTPRIAAVVAGQVHEEQAFSGRDRALSRVGEGDLGSRPQRSAALGRWVDRRSRTHRGNEGSPAQKSDGMARQRCCGRKAGHKDAFEMLRRRRHPDRDVLYELAMAARDRPVRCRERRQAGDRMKPTRRL